MSSKRERVFYECMEEIYQSSTPRVSFRELVEASPKDDQGVIQVPYREYKIPESLLDWIIEKHIKLNRLSRIDSEALRTSIYLGPSPVGIRDSKL